MNTKIEPNNRKKNENFVKSRFQILEKFFDSLPEVPRGSHKLVAGIFDKKGRIVSLGHNSHWKTHPQAPKVDKWKLNGSLGVYQCVHAELHAILQAEKNEYNPRKCSIFVYRKGKDGKDRHSEPCQNCKTLIDFKKIGNVFFHDAEGNVSSEY